MPQVLNCRYTGGDRETVRLSADLGLGWQDMGNVWGFDGSGALHYEIRSTFRCRLRLVAEAPESCQASTNFPRQEYLTRLCFGRNTVMLYGTRLIVDIPLDQVWLPAEDEPRCPSIHESESSLFSLETQEGALSYQLQLWIALYGPTKKFAKHEYEWGEGFAWIGSPPCL